MTPAVQPLITRLWLAWVEPGRWETDPAVLCDEVRILNTLSDTIGLVEYAQRRARTVQVPPWRELWFGEALRALDAAWERRLAECAP